MHWWALVQQNTLLSPQIDTPCSVCYTLMFCDACSVLFIMCLNPELCSQVRTVVGAWGLAEGWPPNQGSKTPVESMLKAFLLAARKAYLWSHTSQCLWRLLFLSKRGTHKLILKYTGKEALLKDCWIRVEITNTWPKLLDPLNARANWHSVGRSGHCLLTNWGSGCCV